MKPLLDWKSKKVVGHYNDVSLWSAPFGKLLLENLPMHKGMTSLDIGFGTGFPLIELSQRLDNTAKVYGVDIWEEAIKRTQSKIRFFGLENVELISTDANHIPLRSESVHCVTSNLGINNFAEKKTVLKEVHRLLRDGGSLCLTTNVKGTFKELHYIFSLSLKELNLPDTDLENYFNARGTESSIATEVEEAGFSLVKKVSDISTMRFFDGEALFNHSLIRIAFRESWQTFVPQNKVEEFFSISIKKINEHIEQWGELKLTIPLLYLQFKK